MHLHLIDSQLAATAKIKDSELLSGLCASVLAMYPNGQPTLPWAGYLAEEGEVMVGSCAFKTAPVAGRVEIAYFTFPEHEGRGVATRMAQQLISLATQHPAPQVYAQTLPQANASTHILEKLGFRFIGPVMHPEDGEVWEWQRD